MASNFFFNLFSFEDILSRQVLFGNSYRLNSIRSLFKKYCYVEILCLLTLQLNRMYLGKYNKYNFLLIINLLYIG